MKGGIIYRAVDTVACIDYKQKEIFKIRLQILTIKINNIQIEYIS